MRQVIESELTSASTDFTVKFADDNETLSRIYLFFQTYGIGKTSYQTSLITGATQHYRYNISKTPNHNGIRYHIECEGVDPNLARRNAKNLARFAKEGTLEVEFLER